MLRKDLIEAVAAGRFHIYEVGTINEGIEILTGIPAGERTDHEGYPKGTVNYRVEQRLEKFIKGLQKFGKQEESVQGYPGETDG
jgi:hypothetical protein